MKAMDKVHAKIKKSKKEAKKFLVAVGIIDKKGNITPR